MRVERTTRTPRTSPKPDLGYRRASLASDLRTGFWEPPQSAAVCGPVAKVLGRNMRFS
jgi:hypothetical protein